MGESKRRAAEIAIKRRQSKHLRRVVESLRLANTICLTSRFDSLHHCIEASNAGAQALTAHGIEARVTPIAVVVSHDKFGYSGVLGLTPKRSTHDFEPTILTTPSPSFDDWVASQLTGTLGPTPLHVVIEAWHEKDRAVIDLTFGQIAQTVPFPVPLGVIWYGDSGWPQMESDSGGFIRYEDCPHKDQLNPEYFSLYEAPGFVSDYLAVMDVALKCNLDEGQFYSVISKANPQGFQLAVKRLRELLGTYVSVET